MKLNFQCERQKKVSLQKLLRILTKINKYINNTPSLFRKTRRSIQKQQNEKLMDFDEEYESSVKSLAITKEAKVNLTSRFLNGKLLMFSKNFIQSFAYD